MNVSTQAAKANLSRTCNAGALKSTDLRPIANKARKDKKHRFNNLYGMLNESMLMKCWHKLNKASAAGVDRISPKEFGRNLEANIRSIAERLKRKCYRAPLIRRQYIPKSPNKKRPLGIPTVGNKVVEKAAAEIVGVIYEADFLPCSYAYRANISIHQAVKELDRELCFGGYRYVVEADIKGFFDHINHPWLIRMLKQRIEDKWMLRLIGKWLKAGVLEEDGKVIHPESGTPQGGIISPILANIYLHYVIDLWFEKKVKARCEGKAKLIRYADDFVVLFEKRRDAQAFHGQIGERLKKFGLELAQDKTRIVEMKRQEKEGQIDFLGFSFRWGNGRHGKTVLQRVTAHKKLHGALERFAQWGREMRTKPWKQIMSEYRKKLRGHYNYYGLRGNGHRLASYYYQTRRILHRWINRRSQKRSMTWVVFGRALQRWGIPRPRIVERREKQTEFVFCWNWAEAS